MNGWLLDTNVVSERRITFSQPDLLIAATARVHSLALCTRNEKDFEELDNRIFNPWSG